MKYYSGPSSSAQWFSLEAFKFIADHPFVFVHCHVIVCNAMNPASQCAKKCPSSGRGKRVVGDHVIDDVYFWPRARSTSQEASERERRRMPLLKMVNNMK